MDVSSNYFHFILSENMRTEISGQAGHAFFLIFLQTVMLAADRRTVFFIKLTLKWQEKKNGGEAECAVGVDRQ